MRRNNWLPSLISTKHILPHIHWGFIEAKCETRLRWYAAKIIYVLMMMLPNGSWESGRFGLHMLSDVRISICVIDRGGKIVSRVSPYIYSIGACGARVRKGNGAFIQTTYVSHFVFYYRYHCRLHATVMWQSCMN